jgi:hypothetical protein
MAISKVDRKRFERTISFLKRVEPNCKTILDLGTRNDLSKELERFGYQVTNTQGEDLDLNPEALSNYKSVDVVTAFEILEHLVSPFTLLKNLQSNNLVATVPLKLWFVKAYRSRTNEFDMHYHEFEDWQFDMLLNKAGWTITYSEKWKAPTFQIGIRPFLRFFYPRFYAVHATRKSPTFNV